MIAIAVDDEPLMLGALVKAIQASPDIASVSKFTSCEDTVHWVREHKADVAFLDINMRGIGGLELAKQIMELCPGCKIIFCTGYEEYAVSAFKLRASGYLMKPISAAEVQGEIDNIKGIKCKEKLLTAKCFGNFELTSKGNKIPFKRSKSKEFLAFLIDRNGSGVTSMEICIALWGDQAEEKCRGYFHQLLMDIRQSLSAVGADAVFEKTNNRYSVDVSRIECDYFDYLKNGKPEFRGEYMMQYSWAEETCGFLWSKQ